MITHIATEEQAEALGFVDTPRDYHAQHHTGRYAVTVNVGHDGNPFALVPWPKRARLYYFQVAKAFEAAGLIIYPGHALIAREVIRLSLESTDVLSFDVATLTPRGNIGRIDPVDLEAQLCLALFQLSVRLEQEAVAAWVSDSGARDPATQWAQGFIAGPQWRKWGEFNEALFIRPDASPLVYAAPYKASQGYASGL